MTERTPPSGRRGSLGLLTTGLLLALAAICAAVGYFLLGTLGLFAGLLLVVSGVAAAATLPVGLAMRLQGGLPLPSHRAPGLHATVAQLAQRAGIRPPELYLLPSATPNAMSVASVRNEGAVAVSVGLLRLLERAECEGVIAHEIAHLRNRDTTLLQVAGSLLSTLQMLLRIALWVAVIGLFLGAVPPAAVLWTVLLAIGVPLVAVAAHQALARTREFAADETAAELTRQPLALASALRKLSHVERRLMSLVFGVTTAPPWMRSHPATGERIRRLEQMDRRGSARPSSPPFVTFEPRSLLR